MTLFAEAMRAEDPEKLAPGTVLPVGPTPDVPGVIAFVSPVGPRAIVVPPGGDTVIGLTGLVVTLCPLPKVPIEFVLDYSAGEQRNSCSSGQPSDMVRKIKWR